MSVRIIIAPDEWEKFENYVDLIDKEIACFGYITKLESGDLYVDEIFLVPQEVSGTSVDFVSSGLAYAVRKAVEDERVEDLRFCIHSHVNMGVGFSQDDHEMIGEMGKSGTPWFASVIFNKKREVNGRIDMFELPIDFGRIKIDGIDVVKGITDDELDARIKEIEEFVEEKKFTAPKSSGKGGKKGNKGKSEPTHQPYQSSWEQEAELVKRAQKEGWEAVVRGGIAYFWDPESGRFMGEALLTVDEYDDLEEKEQIKDQPGGESVKASDKDKEFAPWHF